MPKGRKFSGRDFKRKGIQQGDKSPLSPKEEAIIKQKFIKLVCKFFNMTKAKLFIKSKDEKTDLFELYLSSEKILPSLISLLTKREAKIINLRYCEYPVSLEKVGKIFKITRERVRQIERNAIWKLRIASQNAL